MLAKRRHEQRGRPNVATLTIRNLEEQIVAALKARAKRNQRSLEAEVRELLRDVAAGGSPETLRDLADQIAALTPAVRQTDSTELVRADRGR
jgi:plasmid stability protein